MSDDLSTRLIRRRRVRAADPVSPSLHESTTFLFENAAAVRRFNETGEGFLYSRYGSPTLRDIEGRLADIDGAEDALLFASGMAATSTLLMALVRPGDEVVCPSATYGGTCRLLRELLPRFGVETRFVTLEAMARPDELPGPRTRLVWFESPVNPHLRCIDIAAVTAACRARGVLSVVDNTFASPVNQRPLELGADLTVQSATKYLGGHSDVTAGLVTGPSGLLAPIENARRLLGGILDPRAAHALGRSLRTLVVRVERQNLSALQIARALEGAPGVARVLYPGLPSHPDHALASRQMRGYGGMVCVEVEGGEAAACRVFDRLALVGRAASLGGVESLCSLPVLTSHWGFTPGQLDEAGVTGGMLRLSIGLESVDDLLADLRQALG